MYLRSPLLDQVPGIQHGFGSRSEELPEPFKARWDERRPRWHQVHGVGIAHVTQAAEECGQVDALWNEAPGVPIAIQTADCVPVLLAARDGHAVAAVHAGWRGTRARILRELWRKLEARGEKACDWVAAIGPSIGPCCYEVSEEIARDFESEFGSFGPGLAVPKHRILDLPAINAAELRGLGLAQVDLLRACTRCSLSADGQDVYWSFRRDGSGKRQWSAIWIRA